MSLLLLTLLVYSDFHTTNIQLHQEWAIRTSGYPCPYPDILHMGEDIYMALCPSEPYGAVSWVDLELVTVLDSLGRYRTRMRVLQAQWPFPWKAAEADVARRKAGQPLLWLR